MPDYVGEPEVEKPRRSLRNTMVGHDPMKHSPWPCPQCGALRLVRKRLAWYLRPWRRVGFRVKEYSCESCHRRSVRWRSKPS